MLDIDNLNVAIGGKEILKNVSFSLAKSQNLLVLGANGAGKSTLAKAMCAILSSKCVSMDGKIVSAMSPKQRARLINYVPPKLESFEEEITALDFLLLGFFWRKSRFEPISKEEKGEALGLLERFGLLSLSGERIGGLSSGERQSLLILQAALQKSAVTIFDEPISNIDVTRGQTLFSALFTNELFLQKIVITHDLQFAYSLGFDALYLKDGRVDFFGSKERFFELGELAKRFGDRVSRFDGGVVINYAKI